MGRAQSVREILAKRFRTFPFEGKWKEAFGLPERTGVWFIWGNTANGKTSFAMQFCKYLCRFEKVVYNSNEEGDRLTMQETLKRFNMVEVARRFTVVNETTDELSERLKKPKSPNIAVIDSFQYGRLTYKKFCDFVDKHPNKLLIFISRADGTLPRGKAAQEAAYDAALKIYVEGFRAHNNGRTTGEDPYYDIWPEKALIYWRKKNESY